MAITVRVRDFQSIEDATVVIDGFTVVTGPNNSGKTALMRAIRGVFLNSPAGPLVRRGTACLIVDIDFGDGNTVTWEKGWEKPSQKGKTVNKYTVNGVELDGVGRGCPPEVLTLGMNPIKAGTDTVWPQIADQFKGVLFLVGSPGSAMAEAIANVDRVGKLSAALKLSEKERRKVSGKLGVRREDEKTLTAEAEVFDGLDAVAGQVEAVEAATKDAEALFTEMAIAMSLRRRRGAATSEVEAYAGVEEVQVPPAELVQASRGLRGELAVVGRLQQRAGAYGTEVLKLQGIEKVVVPGTKAVKAARDLRGEVSDHQDLATRVKDARDTLERYDGFDGVKIPDASRVVLAKKIKTAVGFFKDIASRRDDARKTIDQLEADQLDATVEQDAAETTVAALLAELGACPTCGVATEHTHEGAA